MLKLINYNVCNYFTILHDVIRFHRIGVTRLYKIKSYDYKTHAKDNISLQHITVLQRIRTYLTLLTFSNFWIR